MYEVRLHGRGGQGAVMAAGILAAAIVAEGRYAVSIPAFGFERRGAPVVTFLRVDDREIRRMTNITDPDCVVCIDPTISRAVNVFAGLKAGGTLIQTTGRALGELEVPDFVGTVAVIDAIAIAREIFRRPITNTLMLGAFARVTGAVSLAALKQAIAESDLRDANPGQNMTALDRGFNEVEIVHRNRGAA
ncbi:MAG: 2-oxoacid:acceptor oxidoreductase family protein [Alphaproteobacteria bacterium]|nr:2-oxoacid:acceptor oxidoreductase family protein [Alphaproteobacteria bacterium]